MLNMTDLREFSCSFSAFLTFRKKFFLLTRFILIIKSQNELKKVKKSFSFPTSDNGH